MTIEFTNRTSNAVWMCTTVYGPNARHLKQGFWDEIKSCHSYPLVPWVISGDFNSIFSLSNKSNGTFNCEDICLAQALIMDNLTRFGLN